VFFSKWQLLFAVKMICVYGLDDLPKAEATVPADDIVRLLLIVNDFIHRDFGEADPLDSKSDQWASVKGQLISQTVLFSREQPRYLIGRYYDLFTVRGSKQNRSRYDNWVDIDDVMANNYGFSHREFQAVLLGLYASIPQDIENRRQIEGELDFSIDPESWFEKTRIDDNSARRILEAISCTPDQVREDHGEKYGDGVGRVYDVVYLLRHPAILLSSTRLAPLSRQTIVQRYTAGLYWDVHDVLPNRGAPPNKQQFQAFYGRVLEDYGRDLLERIASQDKRRRSLIWETEYQSGSEKTTDGLLLESIGTRYRCNLFEFTVGRPRLEDTVLSGNLDAFDEDLNRKIGSAVNQQIDVLRRVLQGEKTIDGLDPQKTSKWLICVVVSDPYPSYETLVSTLNKDLDELRDEGVDVSGVYVLSLEELELIETLTKKNHVSQLLLDWKSSHDARMPFKNYFDTRIRNTKGEQVNEYVFGQMDAAMNDMKALLYPDD